MPNRKHTKKNKVVICSDTNQTVRESNAEKKRIATALRMKYEKLKKEYEEEMKRRETEKDVIGKTLKQNEEKKTPDPVNA